MFQANVVEKIKKRISYSITFFFRKSRHYEIMWKKNGTAIQATKDSIIRRVGIAYWITKARDTLVVFNIHCFSTAKMVARTRLIFTFIRTLPVLFSS
jgi:hypothetical protein